MGIQSIITGSINSVANQSGSVGSSSNVLSAIQKAAFRTGVDFSYLVQKASTESSLNANAQASTSSATGLFQFTSQTWLQMVKNDGAQYGLGQYASQITADSSGHLSVSDPATKKAILDLRKDPTISAEMAGELDKQNAASLKSTVGGKIGGTELYLAHFLGAGGASNFISEMRADSSTPADQVLPEAAAANPSVFYTKSGEARTLGQIYQHFAQKFDSIGGTTQIASAAVKAKYASVASAPAAASAPIVSGVAAMPTLQQVASLYVPGTQTASSGTASGIRAAGAGGVTTSGSSTLFTAMVLGQINNNAIDPTAALSALNAGEKKRDNLGTLAAVA